MTDFRDKVLRDLESADFADFDRRNNQYIWTAGGRKTFDRWPKPFNYAADLEEQLVRIYGPNATVGLPKDFGTVDIKLLDLPEVMDKVKAMQARIKELEAAADRPVIIQGVPLAAVFQTGENQFLFKTPNTSTFTDRKSAFKYLRQAVDAEQPGRAVLSLYLADDGSNIIFDEPGREPATSNMTGTIRQLIKWIAERIHNDALRRQLATQLYDWRENSVLSLYRQSNGDFTAVIEGQADKLSGPFRAVIPAVLKTIYDLADDRQRKQFAGIVETGKIDLTGEDEDDEEPDEAEAELVFGLFRWPDDDMGAYYSFRTGVGSLNGSSSIMGRLSDVLPQLRTAVTNNLPNAADRRRFANYLLGLADNYTERAILYSAEGGFFARVEGQNLTERGIGFNLAARRLIERLADAANLAVKIGHGDDPAASGAAGLFTPPVEITDPYGPVKLDDIIGIRHVEFNGQHSYLVINGREVIMLFAGMHSAAEHLVKYMQHYEWVKTPAADDASLMAGIFSKNGHYQLSGSSVAAFAGGSIMLTEVLTRLQAWLNQFTLKYEPTEIGNLLLVGLYMKPPTEGGYEISGAVPAVRFSTRDSGQVMRMMKMYLENWYKNEAHYPDPNGRIVVGADPASQRPDDMVIAARMAFDPEPIIALYRDAERGLYWTTGPGPIEKAEFGVVAQSLIRQLYEYGRKQSYSAAFGNWLELLNSFLTGKAHMTMWEKNDNYHLSNERLEIGIVSNSGGGFQLRGRWRGFEVGAKSLSTILKTFLETLAAKARLLSDPANVEAERALNALDDRTGIARQVVGLYDYGEDGKTWLVSSELPGRTGGLTYSGKATAAERAESVLNDYLDRDGGVLIAQLRQDHSKDYSYEINGLISKFRKNGAIYTSGNFNRRIFDACHDLVLALCEWLDEMTQDGFYGDKLAEAFDGRVKPFTDRLDALKRQLDDLAVTLSAQSTLTTPEARQVLQMVIDFANSGPVAFGRLEHVFNHLNTPQKAFCGVVYSGGQVIPFGDPVENMADVMAMVSTLSPAEARLIIRRVVELSKSGLNADALLLKLGGVLPGAATVFGDGQVGTVGGPYDGLTDPEESTGESPADPIGDFDPEENSDDGEEPDPERYRDLDSSCGE
jgi:hypothetical protein